MTSENRIDNAVMTLLKGYETEVDLYSEIRDLSASQREKLMSQQDLASFCELYNEKEGLLDVLGQIDTELTDAKTVVLTSDPETCPCRERLNNLLGSVTNIIEEICDIERENAAYLEKIPA